MKREEEIYQASDEWTYRKPPQYSELVHKSRKVMCAYQVGFIDGAVWADKTMIDKACEWLDKNLVTVDHDIIYNGLRTRKQLVDEYIKNFRKAMKGE